MMNWKHSLSMLVLGLPLACGSSSSGGGSGSGGNAPLALGGSDSGLGGGSATGQGGTTLAFGGSNSTSGGLPGNGSFDGGEVLLTPEQKDAITQQACAGLLTEGESLPSQLELVVDTSSSMKDTAPGTNESKWAVTRDALLDAIVGVNGPGLPASVAVGLLFYPNLQYTISKVAEDVSKCVNTSAMVPIAPLGPKAGSQRTLIGTAINQVQLLLSTPTDDAYSYALDNALLPSTLPGKKFMLLITDGTPTLSKGCMNPSGQVTDVDPEPVVAEVTRAARAGIKTFLIGSPGSENNRNWMSRAAVIGGTAEPGCNVNGPNYCHMDMTTAGDFSQALRAGLAKVVGQVTPCTFTFADAPPGESIDAANINVILSSSGQSSLVVRDDFGDCTQGWRLTADQEIQLCPDTCSQVKADAGVDISVLFGCGSLTEPPPVR